MQTSLLRDQVELKMTRHVSIEYIVVSIFVSFLEYRFVVTSYDKVKYL